MRRCAAGDRSALAAGRCAGGPGDHRGHRLLRGAGVRLHGGRPLRAGRPRRRRGRRGQACAGGHPPHLVHAVGAQLGITVTGLLVGYVAEPLIGESLGALLGGVGIPTGVSVGVGAVLALLFSTIVQMLFGELFPKNLAIARAEPVARALSRSTLMYLKLFGWLIWVFDQASNLLLRALRIEPVHDVEHSATPRDLEHIVAESRSSGDLPEALSLLLDRILDFPRQDVEHAMIPRAQVGAVRGTDPVARVRELMGTGHSRYPVLDSEDRIVGVIHLEDLLDHPKATDVVARDVARPAVIVPTVMSLPDALHELTSTKSQLACVIDEYGGLAGVLTLEDLAEELVGEITDEHDGAVSDLGPSRDEDGAWVMNGDTHIDEVERALGRHLPRGDYETIAGLVIATQGSLPQQDSTVEVVLDLDPADLAHTDEPPQQRVLIEVLAIERYVPTRVRLRLPDTMDADSPTPTPKRVDTHSALIHRR